jgi:hypothetical protein
MAVLLNQDLEPARSIGTGLFLWLRSWFEACRRSSTQAPLEQAQNEAPFRLVGPVSNARLLPFPIRGEALLVGMAERLRQRVGDRCWTEDPLLLFLSRCPNSRLTIDRNTYVEFDAGRSAYRVVLDAAPGTRFTVETFDFDAVVSFVAPYVTDRLAEAIPLGAAS